jgi:hypothetical protein
VSLSLFLSLSLTYTHTHTTINAELILIQFRIPNGKCTEMQCFKYRSQRHSSATLFSAEFGISVENISLLSAVKMTLFVLFQGPPKGPVPEQNE